MRAALLLLLAPLLAPCGCAGPVEAIKVASPGEASGANGTPLHAVAILRGDQRAGLPAEGVTVQGNEVLIARPGTFTYRLDPGEDVGVDEQGRVAAVRTPGNPPTITYFVPGTAVHVGNEVRGELKGHQEHVPLLPSDKLEMRGTFAPGETIPLGGEVEVQRAWSALIFGGSLFALGYIPSVAVAAGSPHDYDRMLYLPLFGPWVDLVQRDNCTPDPIDPTKCFADGTARIGLIVDGIVQDTGLLLMLVGLPSYAVVEWGKKKQARVRVGPTFGRVNGVGVQGSF